MMKNVTFPPLRVHLEKNIVGCRDFYFEKLAKIWFGFKSI